MKHPTIPFSPPDITDVEIQEVVRTLQRGWLTTGEQAASLEHMLVSRTGAPAALAVSSCTAALTLSLRALGVGPGDRVLTSPLTFCSAVHAVEHVGAVPEFVDVESRYLNMCTENLSERLRSLRTRGVSVGAIMPVHYGGLPAQLEHIYELASEFDVAVIEDAAHALGAYRNGAPVGRINSSLPGHTVCFSFYATKNMTTAEGGALVGTPAVVEQARILSLHGMTKGAHDRYGPGGTHVYDVTDLGYKANLSDVLAAIGVAQLRRFDAMQTARRQTADVYTSRLRNNHRIVLPETQPGSHHAWHLYPVRLTNNATSGERDRVVAAMRAAGVHTSVHFRPVPDLEYYKKRYATPTSHYAQASRAYNGLISLPLHANLHDAEVEHICDTLQDAVAQA